MAGTGFDGSIKIDSQVDTRGFNKGVKSMGQSLKPLMGKIALIFGTAAIIAFGKSSVKAASDLTNALIGMNSVVTGTGGSFTKAQEFITQYIKDGLVPATDAITAFKNLALRGYSTEQIIKTMNALKDAAAFGRQSSMSMGDAIRSASEGLKNENSILVDNAGVTKNVSKMWEDYAKKIGVATTSLTKEQKIEAEVAGIMEETRFQQGDAAKMADTFSGRVSALSTSFMQLKVAIGNAIIPILGAIIPYVKAAIDWLVALFTVFAQFMQALFGIKLALGGVADAGEEASDATGDMAGNTEKTGKAAKGALAAFDEINVLQQASSGAGGGDTPSPTAPGIPDPDEVGSTLDTMLDKVAKFKAAMLKLFGPVIDALGRLRDALIPLGETIWEGLKWAWDNILVPLAEWTITELLPEFIDLLAGAALILNAALIALQPLGIWLWENFLKPLATWTGGVIISTLQWLNEQLVLLAAWITENPEKFRTIATVIGLVVLAFAAATAIVAVWNVLAGVGAAVTGAFAAATAFLASPVVLITLAILALIGIVYLLITYWPELSAAATAAWKWIQGIWAVVANWFNTNVIQPISTWFSTAWTNIKNWATAAWLGISILWNTVSTWFNDNVIKPLSKFFTDFWGTIGKIATNAWILISLAWAVVSAWFRDNVITPVQTAFDTALLAVSGFFSSAWTTISTLWTTVSEWFRIWVVDPLSSGFDIALLAIAGFFTSAWETVKTLWNTASAWFKTWVIDPLKNAFNIMLTGSADGNGDGGIIGGFTKAFNGIVSIVKGAINGVISALNGIISGAVTGINGLIDALNAVGSVVPGWTTIGHLNAPQIPLLAKGAIIPPNSQFMAILGDQRSGKNIEAPESLIRQIIQEEMGTQQTEVKVAFEGSLGALVRELQPIITQETTRVGKSMIG